MDPGRLRAALAKVDSDPYDVDAWMVVIKDAQSKSIEETRDTMEKLVEAFPTSGRFWKIYIEQEVREKDECRPRLSLTLKRRTGRQGSESFCPTFFSHVFFFSSSCTLEKMAKKLKLT